MAIYLFLTMVGTVLGWHGLSQYQGLTADEMHDLRSVVDRAVWDTHTMSPTG